MRFIMQWNRQQRFESDQITFITVLDPQYMSDEEDGNGKDYPLGPFWTVHDGYDISRSNTRIVAIVVVSRAGSEAKELRFYSWRKKGDEWKVELARTGTKNWDWEKLAMMAKGLKQKHGIV